MLRREGEVGECGTWRTGGYYAVDPEDIARLVATNRDFMWNQQVQGAKFRRIDGEPTDDRWKNSPGVLWSSLIPHDETLRRIFIANHNPGTWAASTSWFLALQKS